MNNYKVNNLHINGKVASGIIKGLWYRVTFDFIPTKEEWEEIPNDYKTNYIVDYTKKEIIDKTIKSAFLPGYGTTLFFENRHFLIVDDKKPLKKYAIWRNHEVIGYCEIDKATADKANKANNAYFYLGFDKVTNPEKY